MRQLALFAAFVCFAGSAFGQIQGRWDFDVKTAAGDDLAEFELKEANGVVEGRYSGVLGPGKPLKGTYGDGELSISFTGDWPDGTPAEVTVTGKLSADAGSGSVVVKDRTDGTWVARRPSPTKEPAVSARPIAAAADGRWAAFAGEWELTGRGAESVETAIRQATEPMNSLVRGVARGRLQKSNAAPAKIRMERREEVFVIAFEGASPVTLPLSGAAVKTGDRTMQLQLEDVAALRQVVETREGTRENVYRLDAKSDSMTMDVKVTSPRLPAPVQYSLEFKRVRLAASATGGAQ